MLHFTIPGGNGFGDISVLATDPLGFVQDEMNKRAEPFDTSTEIVVPDSPHSTSFMGTDLSAPLKDWWGGEMQKLSDNAKGLVVAVLLALLGIVVIAFGLYNLTKD